MKNLFTATVMAISIGAASFSAMADTQYFVGGSFGSANLSYTHKDNDIKLDEDESSQEMSFRAGALLNNDIRVYGSYATNDYDGLDQTAFKINADKLFMIQDKIYLFAGGAFGATTFKGGDISESGFIYGFQFGSLFEAAENLTLEASWAYDMTTAEYEYADSTGGYVFEANLTFDSVSTIKLGANYAF